MSIVTIRDVTFQNNPAPFSADYKFRVTFDCIAPLSEDLEWKLIYVPSPNEESRDQELDDCLVGPIPQGVNTFDFEASAPDPHIIPPNDLLGVSALILTGSYKDQEFVRVGYYQNTEYKNEAWKENPPDKPVFEDLVRDINAKPRVTRFQIKWDVTPPGTGSQVGAAASAAVPSADALDDAMDTTADQPNGAAQ